MMILKQFNGYRRRPLCYLLESGSIQLPLLRDSQLNLLFEQEKAIYLSTCTCLNSHNCSWLTLKVVTAPNTTITETQAQLMFCIQEDFNYSIFQSLIFWPIALRFHYINQVSSVIRNFYEDKDQLKARQHKRKLICVLFISLGSLAFVILMLCIAIISDREVNDVLCLCTDHNDTIAQGVNIGLRVLMFLFEITFFAFSFLQLVRHKVKTKYGIRCELLTVSFIYLIQRVQVIVSLAFFRCDQYDYKDLISSIALMQISCIVIFTMLVVVVLFKRRNPKYENHIVPQNLLHSFPEALYFWTPNYYFNLFLRENHPQLLNYRPLMADILRYDFQIQEANNCPVDCVRNTESNQGFEMKLMRDNQKQSLRTMFQSNPELKKLYYFVLYIEVRYFGKDSRSRCTFVDQPQVLQNIQEKFQNLQHNLDQFLFEFVRPYIEEKLTPIYEHFMESQGFKKMQKDLEVGEVFEWMISYQKTM